MRLSAFRQAAALLVAGGVAASPQAHEQAAPQAQPAAMTMGGYREDHSARDIYAERDRARYLKEKRELEKALRDCADGKPCDAHIAAFAQMIDDAHKIPDPLKQAEIVNAWVNLAVEYDYAEADAGKIVYRTMKNAIRDYKGICYEMAELKLFALEKLDFAARDVRLVGEDVFVGGKPEPYGHAIVEVRAAGAVWAMNVPTDPPAYGYIEEKDAVDGALQVSKMESAATHLNFSGRSAWYARGHVEIPVDEFNAAQAAHYGNSYVPRRDLSNVPQEARLARGEATQLEEDTLRKIGGMKILASAFAAHNTIHPSAPDILGDFIASLGQHPAP